MSVHDDIVSDVAESLKRKGYHVETFVEYHRGKYSGEMDVFARIDEFNEYHEIKCSDNPRAEKRAIRQFLRARRAMPGRWRFYIHTPYGSREVIL